MESDNIYQTTNDNTYKLSWIAYIKPIIIFIIILIVGIALSCSKTIGFSITGYFVVLFGAVNFLCSLIYLRTLRLYLNEDGVRLFHGIFPWTKGTEGTNWRDISDATYYTGLISWATNSYKVRIGHRFTKTSELIIPHVKNGKTAVITINEKIASKFRDKE
ncbi:hypothetical protein IOC09_005182 [Escherichia coli]|nr:hypothetical protein [Escherichia coli]